MNKALTIALLTTACAGLKITSKTSITTKTSVIASGGERDYEHSAGACRRSSDYGWEPANESP